MQNAMRLGKKECVMVALCAYATKCFYPQADIEMMHKNFFRKSSHLLKTPSRSKGERPHSTPIKYLKTRLTTG